MILLLLIIHLATLPKGDLNLGSYPDDSTIIFKPLIKFFFFLGSEDISSILLGRNSATPVRAFPTD
jgi:hypothetical protein